MMMSSAYDTNLYIDESWIDYNTGCTQMLSFINPDEICPTEHLQPQPLTTIYQQQQPHYQQQSAQLQIQQTPSYRLQQNNHLTPIETKTEKNTSKLPNNSPIDSELALNDQQQQQSDYMQQQSIEHLQIEPNYEVIIDTSQGDTANLGPPPILVPRDDYKFSSIQQRLDYERALSHQRREQLRLQLEREPPKLPANINKRPSGKKLTGRERLLELERTEAELLKQKNRYVDLITTLESKCQKLREVLGDIVMNSPEYNSKFVNFLDSNGLFIDSHINGLAD
jgi:hypothetical protein